MMPTLTASGPGNGFQPNSNGKKPPAARTEIFIPGATSGHSINQTTLTKGPRALNLWAPTPKAEALMGYMICRETYGNG